MIRPAILLTALMLGACASGSTTEEPGTPAWQCDAAAQQHLVGTNVAAVSFPAGANVRMVCTTCAMTRDYRPDRLTILFNEQSGHIEEVRCV